MQGKRNAPTRLASAIVFVLLLLAAVPALAWEWNYGPPLTLDDGYRRVLPVPSCGASFPNPGYIAIGTQDIGSPNPDVYVVYTNVLGNAAGGWEAVYDVQALGFADDGVAIAIVPNKGYVFLSNTLDGVWMPALTFIDCKGNVLWSQIYPDVIAGQNLWGNDLIRTQSGDPLQGMNPGDYAVAGRWFNGANEDAFLMRTDAAGNLLWNIAHDNQGLNEAFNALTEALPIVAGATSDLVAVGRLTTTANDQQALVARVNGNNGAIGAAPQCMQHHGNAGTAEVYNSVTNVQTFFPGQFVFVGNTTGGNWQQDIWVTRGNTCPLNAQARFGNPGGAVTNERGNDIIEVLVPKPGAPAGWLAIAGDHTPAVAGAPFKGARMLLNPGLNVVAGQNFIFGAPPGNPNFGIFYSLAEDPAPWPIPLGYPMAGLTRSPIAGADPMDLYLAHDDPAVVPFCEQAWNPVKVITAWPQIFLQPSRKAPARHTPVHTGYFYESTGIQTCAP